MTDKSLMIMDTIPEPMSPLTREIIHPENIALEIRIRKAALLKGQNIVAMKIERFALSRRVNLEAYQQQKAEIKTLTAEIANKRDVFYLALHDTLQAHAEGELNTPTMLEILGLIPQVKKHIKSLQIRRMHILKEVTSKREIAEKLISINKTIEAYQLAKKHAIREQEIRDTLYKEAGIYASFIKQEWAARDDCHYTIYSKDGRSKKIIPQFDKVDVTATRIYYKILTSYKGLFGFKRGLPGDVSVSNLIKDDVLLNIQSACSRPVTSIVKPNGVWVVVDRTGVIGGLPEYIEYNRILEFYPDFMREQYPLCLGVSENAEIVYLTLADYPHFLIAGWTGSGKSNIVNVLISTLISQHSPAELRLLLIDMKGGLEFRHYEGLPHSLTPIIEEISHVAAALSKLEAEMEQRFKLLRGRRAKHLHVYNERVAEADKLPRIAVFFDEMATLFKQGSDTKLIVASLQNLSAKGRAVGIHLFLCTQHPSVEILPGSIKTNMTVRLAGRMPTSSSSMTVLGTGEASKLDPVKGRMMLMIGPDPKPIQTPFISDDEIYQSLHTAMEYEPHDYNLPESGRTHESWNVERIIELALTHLGGNVSASRIHKEVSEISRSQARDLAEKIWEMETVEHNEQIYKVSTRRGGARYLEPIES